MPFSLLLIQQSHVAGQPGWQTNGNGGTYTSDKVGIGLTNPARPFHIVSYNYPEKIRLQDLSTSGFDARTTIGFYKADARLGYIGYGSSSNNDFRILSDSGTGIGLYTNGNNLRFFVNKDGNVGIGVGGNPKSKLHINGAIRGNINSGAIRIESDHGNVDIGAMNPSYGNIDTDRPKFVLNKPVISLMNTFSSYSTNDLIFSTQNADNEVLRVKNNGDIIATGGIQLSEAAEAINGMVQWNAQTNDLELYKDNNWISLTQSVQPVPPQSIWVTINTGVSCFNRCPNGYIAAEDINGDVCKNSAGQPGKTVDYGTINGVGYYVCVDYASGGYSQIQQNAKCHCVYVGSGLNNFNNTGSLAHDNSLENQNLVEIKDNQREPDTYNTNLSDSKLRQNVPNPFRNSTRISFYMPENSNDAKIEIWNLSGELIKSIDITDKGDGAVNFNAENLTNGQYFYTLIIDGQVAETKKMIKR